MNYQKINTIGGWSVFLIATIVYVMTLEPTTSLWDCGEYIATSYKLEVGHPPGAPLFMMLGRLFSWFASPDNVAYMINLMSALSSSLSIMFLFWTITALGRKLALLDGEKLDSGKIIAVLGSGAIGALSYAFTDSFWFSAVEAEVYAMSSLFTAIVFWAILKWERVADEPNSDRWLILIMFLMGLSIGVHLLNLLAIPAIAFVFYFKKYKTTVSGIVITALIGIGLLGIIQALIIPGLIDIGEIFERSFVNSLGLPFYSGTLFYFALIAAIIILAIRYSQKSNNQWVYRSAVGLGMLIIGYSCFAMITIRSNANPPIDENNPEDFVSLSAYLKREQYGSWPIVYGQYYNAALADEYGDKSPVHARKFVVVSGEKDVKGFEYKEDAEAYASQNGGEVVEKYYRVSDGKGLVPAWKDEHKTVLPRMWSNNTDKWDGYEYWSGHDNTVGTPIQYRRGLPERHQQQTLPTFGENLTYMFSYQINWMYFRYFFWNFAGRQNDEQGTRGNPLDGNWLSGVSFIDSQRLGNQANVPDSITSNPSYNRFFMIPLILGIIGFIFHLYRSRKDWSVVLLLFLFTGLAIVFYLNQQPDEPRERDYAYAASFYAFAIWIGLSVYALYYAAKSLTFKELGKLLTYCGGTAVGFFLVELVGGTHHALSFSIIYISVIMGALGAIMIALRDKVPGTVTMAGLSILLTLPSPILLAVEGWDDHDRSDRYSAEALAHNYLVACNDNGVIFTSGDNDTFPLWYLQEVEGFKSSVRVCNLSLLHSAWYAEQMARKAYESEALPIKFTKDQYSSTDFDQIPVQHSPNAFFQEKYEANQDIIKEMFPKLLNVVAQYVQQTPIAQEKPEIVDYIKNFNNDKSYAEFVTFLREMEKSGQIPSQVMSQIKQQQGQFHKSWDYMPLDVALDLLRDESNMVQTRSGDMTFVIPSRRFVIDVDKEAVIASGQVPEELHDQIAEKMRIDIGGRSSLTRSEIMVLEIINQNKDWSRPIYFGSRASRSTYLGFDQYFQLEGLVYHLLPLEQSMERASRYTYGSIDVDKMFDNMVNKFTWGNLNKKGVLVDYYNRRQINHYRIQFLFLIRSLIDKNDIERAHIALDRCFEALPLDNVPIDYNDAATDQIITSYFIAAQKAKDDAVKNELINSGIALAQHSLDRNMQNIKYYTTLGNYDYFRRTFSRMSSDFESIALYYDMCVNDPQMENVLPESFVNEVTAAYNTVKEQMLKEINDMIVFYEKNASDDPAFITNLKKSIAQNFGRLFQDEVEKEPKPRQPINMEQPSVPVDTSKP